MEKKFQVNPVVAIFMVVVALGMFSETQAAVKIWTGAGANAAGTLAATRIGHGNMLNCLRPVGRRSLRVFIKFYKLGENHAVH